MPKCPDVKNHVSSCYLIARRDMTGGGLYVLVAYGAQNVLLSGNPDFTYWYLVVKKFSHFSMESVTIEMDGPNELFSESIDGLPLTGSGRNGEDFEIGVYRLVDIKRVRIRVEEVKDAKK